MKLRDEKKLHFEFIDEMRFSNAHFFHIERIIIYFHFKTEMQLNKVQKKTEIYYFTGNWCMKCL